jgi:hypothetical protein
VVAVLPEGNILSARWGTTIDQEQGKVAYAKRVGRAANGTSSQAKLLQ